MGANRKGRKELENYLIKIRAAYYFRSVLYGTIIYFDK